jgi:hypothetical protein
MHMSGGGSFVKATYVDAFPGYDNWSMTFSTSLASAWDCQRHGYVAVDVQRRMLSIDVEQRQVPESWLRVCWALRACLAGGRLAVEMERVPGVRRLFLRSRHWWDAGREGRFVLGAEDANRDRPRRATKETLA